MTDSETPQERPMSAKNLVHRSSKKRYKIPTEIVESFILVKKEERRSQNPSDTFQQWNWIGAKHNCTSQKEKKKKEKESRTVRLCLTTAQSRWFSLFRSFNLSGNRVAETRSRSVESPIDRHPSENGQELTGPAEGTYPYRYKTDGRVARAQWAAAHARFAPVPLRFHAAGRRPCTGLRRKNSVKDRNRLADRKGEEETRMESRSFGQKATVVSKVYTPPVNTKPGFFSILNRFFYYRRMKGKKVIYKRSFVISILTAMRSLGFLV